MSGSQISHQVKPARAAITIEFPLGLKIDFWFSIAIALAIVVRRVVVQ